MLRAAKKGNVQFLDAGYDAIFSSANRFRSMLTKLRLGEAATFRKRIREARKILTRFKREWHWYAGSKEKIIHHFLKIHVPKLGLPIRFFNLEHQDLERQTDQMDGLLKRLSRDTSNAARAACLSQVQDMATYWFCVLNYHMRVEQNILGIAIKKDLKVSERNRLKKLMGTHASGGRD